MLLISLSDILPAVAEQRAVHEVIGKLVLDGNPFVIVILEKENIGAVVLEKPAPFFVFIVDHVAHPGTLDGLPVVDGNLFQAEGCLLVFADDLAVAEGGMFEQAIHFGGRDGADEILVDQRDRRAGVTGKGKLVALDLDSIVQVDIPLRPRLRVIGFRRADNGMVG